MIFSDRTFPGVATQSDILAEISGNNVNLNRSYVKPPQAVIGQEAFRWAPLTF
jgi:hypothetical protein